MAHAIFKDENIDQLKAGTVTILQYILFDDITFKRKRNALLLFASNAKSYSKLTFISCGITSAKRNRGTFVTTINKSDINSRAKKVATGGML